MKVNLNSAEIANASRFLEAAEWNLNQGLLLLTDSNSEQWMLLNNLCGRVRELSNWFKASAKRYQEAETAGGKEAFR